MASKRKAEDDAKPITLRLDSETLSDIDAYMARLQQQTPGLSLTRTETVRILLRGALSSGLKAKRN